MLFRNIPLGIYTPAESLVHGLQARTKMLLVMWLIIWLEIAGHREWHFVPYVVLVLLIGTGIAFARIPPSEIWSRIRLIVLLFALGVIPMLSSRVLDDRQLYSMGPLIISYGFVRIVLFVGSSIFAMLFVLTFVLHMLKRRPRFKLLKFLILLAALVGYSLFWFISSTPADHPFPVGPYVITYGGVWTIITTFVVLLAFLIFSLLLTMTTSPVAMIEGVTLLLSPLRRLKLPVDDFALMALLALRFIPTLLDETEQLIKAQSARGADLSSGTALERIQSLGMLFVPLIRGSLRRASDLATSLEARGYEATGKQTVLHETTFGAVDYVVLIVIVAMTGSSLLF